MKKNGATGRLLAIMNKRHKTSKFAHEQKNANVLCFLDIEIKRVDNNLEFNVFRKPTTVPRYITSDSHHFIQHKMAAFNSIIDRMLKFPMNITNQREELKVISNIARINRYDDKFVNRIYQI
jgi:hypothetical protein